MNRYHIIFTSSEKSVEGSSGFGVRAASPGTPPAVWAQMHRDSLFNFKPAGPEIQSRITTDPSVVLELPEAYFFRTVTVDKTKMYALGRRISVGYEHKFYLDGRPTRTGNYVTDAYVFPQVPDQSVFEILLGDPASGSRCFVPETPVPSLDNREMAALSLGDCPDLSGEATGFRAQMPPDITPTAIDLLFFFIESVKAGKPLLVKATRRETPALIAALASMLPQSQLGEMTFETNFTGKEKAPGVKMAFLNEENKQQILFPKQWVMADLTTGQKPDTEASRSFRPLIEENVASGNKEQVRNLAGWCLSDLFEKSKEMPRKTQEQIYNYFNHYQAFNPNFLPSDAILRQALAEWFASHPEDSNRLTASMRNVFDTQVKDFPTLFQWMDFVLSLRPVELTDLKKSCSQTITSEIFKSPEDFFRAVAHFRTRLDDLNGFLTPDAFISHSGYLSEAGRDWTLLYPYFLPEMKQQPDVLVKRLIDDKVDPDSVRRVVEREIPDPAHYQEILNSLLGERKYTRKAASMLAESLRLNPGPRSDFFSKWPSEIPTGLMTPLFIWQLETEPVADLVSAHAQVRHLLDFTANDRFSLWAATSRAPLAFQKVLDVMKKALKAGEGSRSAILNDCLALVQSQYNQHETRHLIAGFNVLATVLSGQYVPNQGDPNALWNTAWEIGDREYLKKLVLPVIGVMEFPTPAELRPFTEKALKNSLISKEDLLKGTERSRNRHFILAGIIDHEGKKPKDQLAFLTEEAAMDKNQAMELLKTFFPESHHAIQNPGIMDRIGSLFKKKK